MVNLILENTFPKFQTNELVVVYPRPTSFYNENGLMYDGSLATIVEIMIAFHLKDGRPYDARIEYNVYFHSDNTRIKNPIPEEFILKYNKDESNHTE